MEPDLEAAAAEWRSQFASIKAALAQIKIPPPAIDLDLELFEEPSSSDNAERDIWDLISDDDETDEFESDEVAYESPETGVDWFFQKCASLASKMDTSAAAFEGQIAEILGSKRSEDELQSHLTDLVGFDDLDFVIELLANRDSITAALAATPSTTQGGTRLLSKAERDEALRRKDFEHKSAPLAATRSKDPQYPHVYKSFHANNTISHSGKRYGLPLGSERRQFEKYEEYCIPPGKVGTAGPGQKLVQIADMDGMCRSTFKGYKTLNRMQSLVYPVAYKTNQNMLICAPTGAVSCFQGWGSRLTVSRAKQMLRC